MLTFNIEKSEKNKFAENCKKFAERDMSYILLNFIKVVNSKPQILIDNYVFKLINGSRIE